MINVLYNDIFLHTAAFSVIDVTLISCLMFDYVSFPCLYIKIIDILWYNLFHGLISDFFPKL